MREQVHTQTFFSQSFARGSGALLADFCAQYNSASLSSRGVCLEFKMKNDLTLGIIAVVATALTVGQINMINNFALTQLDFLGIIDDYKTSLMGFINPQVFEMKEFL